MPRRKLGRSWGTRFDPLAAVDSVPSSPEHTLTHRQKPKPAQMSESDGSIHDRVVHDASIFIGSLPSHIEHVELLAMLSEHFAGYSEIQGIKVVRDNKGGTCAFIQCHDPASAASLLLNLRSSPRQFSGRFLRYEPARAFRALLVSYRSPRQYKQDIQAGERTPRLEDSEFTELELPTAMKLIKIPGTRRVNVLYNSDAISEGPDDRNGPVSLLLEPLFYDADTLIRICRFFGPVEHFDPYIPDKDTLGYPRPHDSPRSPIMDSGCWEVKWSHRDDCTNALTTLRRVPHLTVSWAHESDLETHNGQQSDGLCSTFLTTGLWRADGVTQDDIHLPKSSHLVASPHSIQDFGANDHDLPTHQAAPIPSLDFPDKKEQVFSTPCTRPQFRPRALSLNQGRQVIRSPALIQISETSSSSSWESSRETQRARQSTQRFSSSISESNIFSSATFAGFPTAGVTFNGFGTPSRKELDTGILHTSELKTSPVMPKRSGPFIPFTPTSGSGIKSSESMFFQSPRGEMAPLLSEAKLGPVYDPTTVFVGGLEMCGPKAWDERKLRVLFSKYGAIKFVKVVRPINKRLGFAFVTFNNEESSIRAITEEHNRILDGRPIRVQPRDLHPPRSTRWQSSQTKELSRRGSESTMSGDETHDRSETSNITKDLDGLKLGGVSFEIIGPFTPNTTSGVPLQSVTKESPSPNSAYIESEDPDCHMSTKTTATINECRETSAGDNTLPALTASAPPIAGPFMPSPYPVPAIAYYPPQGWTPNFGAQFPYQQVFLAPPYMGYPLPPQPVLPYVQGTTAGPSPASSNPAPAPPGVFENVQSPYPPCTSGRPTTDGDPGPPGSFTPATDPHQQSSWVYCNEVLFMPSATNHEIAPVAYRETPPPGTVTDTLPTPTWLPPPGAPMQAPVFVHPFSHPLPYPGHAGGPHGWLPGQPWHGAMPYPSHRPQISPSGPQFNLAFGPGDTPSKFERSGAHRRHSYRDSGMQYQRNSTGRGPGGRQTRPPTATRGF